MEVSFRVGTQTLTDGAEPVPRLGHQGDVVVSAGHAPYYEMAFRGSLGEMTSYLSSTGTAGVAPGTVLSTTPPFVLYNPTGSGKNLYIIRTRFGYVSGTLGLGQLWYAMVSGQLNKPTGGTALTVQSSIIGNGAPGVGQASQGSTVTATPVIIGPSAIQFGPYAGAGATINPIPVDEIGGSILVAPGNCFVMQAVAGAGTAPLVVLGCDWGEERAA